MTYSLQRLNSIRKADLFDDTKTPSQISTIESDAIDQEDIQHGILSQIKQILGTTNWHDGVPVDLQTAENRTWLYEKNALRWRYVLQDITVPSGQNYYLLLSSNEPPTRNVAISGTTQGAVVAQLSSGVAATLTIGTPATNEVKYDANATGAYGNTISVEHVNTGSLSVSVSGSAGDQKITVNINAGTTTAQQVVDAVNGHADASELVTASTTAGSGNPPAASETNLASGSGGFGANALDEVTGRNALKPKNLVAIFDGDTGDSLNTEDDLRIWGLLQVADSATDGNAFDTEPGQDLAQISFVKANSTFDDLVACTAADVQNKKMFYMYIDRDDLDAWNEQDFLPDVMVGEGLASLIVSLDNAYEGGQAAEVDVADVDWQLADTYGWKVTNPGDAKTLIEIERNDTTGDKLSATLDSIDINHVNSADFAQGLQVDTSDTTINIGHTAAGQIDVASADMDIKTTTSGDLNLTGATDLNLIGSTEINYKDSRETTALPFTDATAGAISALPGGPFASISAAIKYGIEKGGVDLYLNVFTAASNYDQDENVPSCTLDLTNFSIDMNTPSTVTAFVFLNGRLLVGGNGTTNNDVYKGTGNNDLKFDFTKGIKTDDVIITIGLKE